MYVNQLFDGWPPYTDEEVRENKIEVNINDLSAARVAHSAQRQYELAMLSPQQFFTIDIDYGPAWKRREWGATITREVNKLMKRSQRYEDAEGDVFKQVILHGIGPTCWFHPHRWCPKMVAIEDVLLPSKTLVSMENVNYFALYVQFTQEELERLTSGPKVDPGWNMDLVKRGLKWVSEQQGKTVSEAEAFSPEKIGQMEKAKRGLFSDDATPTVDAWMFFYYSDEGRMSGWRRKMVLDSPFPMSSGQNRPARPTRTTRSFLQTRGEFLYDSGKRKYADKLSEIIHFQFGNTSCVAPSYYHTVRALGWLLYSVCHVQNRLSSRFDESVFESLMQYFWANGERDMQRVQQINLTHKKVLPEGLKFVRPEERWTVQEALVQVAMAKNRDILNQTASSYSQDLEIGESAPRETATKTMAKVNASAAIIGSMLAKSYRVQGFQYQEIARRFGFKNSRDADVREFRVRCLKSGVPEEALDYACWNLQPVKVIGSGNQTLQMAMADRLMVVYDRLDPQAQKELKRLYIAVNTQDYALADRWVPDEPVVSDTVRVAQRDAATLLAGLPVAMDQGANHEEVLQIYLTDMATVIQRIQSSGGMADMRDLAGLQNLAGVSVQGQPIPDQSLNASNVRTHLALFAQHESPETKAKVKQYGDGLGKLMNFVKAAAQRLQEQTTKGNGSGQPVVDPKDKAKVAGQLMIAKAKAQNLRESHATRTAQREVQFRQQQAHDEQRQALDMVKEQQQAQAEAIRPRFKTLNE